MYQVTMLCPTTGKTADVPIQVQTMEQFSSMGFEGNSVKCSACGDVHLVNKADLSIRRV